LQVQECKKLHATIEGFAHSKKYEFVWFCETIEEVIWKSRVTKTEKSKKSDEFLRKQDTFRYSEIPLNLVLKQRRKATYSSYVINI